MGISFDESSILKNHALLDPFDVFAGVLSHVPKLKTATLTSKNEEQNLQVTIGNVTHTMKSNETTFTPPLSFDAVTIASENLLRLSKERPGIIIDVDNSHGFISTITEI